MGGASNALRAPVCVRPPRMTYLRALRSELSKELRSPLAALHAACALAAGVACGAYFAYAVWDPSLGVDACVQFLGAMMPLMAGIVCGIAIDEERRAGRLANLLAVPSRGTAVAAKLSALFLMGATALAAALALIAGILAAAGRLALAPQTLVLAWAGTALGSFPLYLAFLAIALRFGRNAAIAVGAAGLVLAFFSVGGLAHGLVTGELVALTSFGVLTDEPFAWSAHLGSLVVEGAIAAAGGMAALADQAARDLVLMAAACAAVSAAGALAVGAWFRRFEGRGPDE